LAPEHDDGDVSPDTTIGLDLGDRFSRFCRLSSGGGKVAEGRVRTSSHELQKMFAGLARCRVVVEVGTHSPWVSRLLEKLGHEVLVANARKLRLIYEARKKSDRIDAEKLARLGRLDPSLLSPVTHRDTGSAEDLSTLRARDALIRTRTGLMNHVRGALKSAGIRLEHCTAETFHARALTQIADAFKPALEPVIETIALVSAQIHELDKRIAALCQKHPETELLRQVDGVGPLIALAFVLTIVDPRRFAKSRTVGAFVGLIPGRSQSGDSDPQRRITKEGDPYLRRLLVQGAQYVLGPFGPDCDLRRFGLALAARGGKTAKKRAVVAVARKLAVLLHRLWTTGEVYEPLRAGSTAVKAVA
jgi:transposase